LLSLTLESGERATIAMLPFVSQRGIVRADELMVADADDHSMAYSQRLSKVVLDLCAEMEPDSVNLLLAHAMVVGGKLGGGERDAHTIFEYSIPTAAFPAHLHYVALGHLHRAQTLHGRTPIEYSGSPLALDFGEEADQKSVTVIEAAADRPARSERIALKAGRKLRTVRGTLDDLIQRAASFGDAFLRVEVTDKARHGLADDVRGALPNAVAVTTTEQAAHAPELAARVEAMKKSPIELFEMYLNERSEYDESLMTLFKELLEARDAAETA
jgi:exonuclease SbcD